MITARKTEALNKYLVFAGAEDHARLWVFARTVSEELGLSVKDEAVRDATLKIVSDLLRAGYIRPGLPTLDGGFEAWTSLSPEEVLDRVARAWPGPKNEPIIEGDAVWFEATKKGEEYVAGYSPENSGLAAENVE